MVFGVSFLVNLFLFSVIVRISYLIKLMIFLSIIIYSKILDKLSFYASGISLHLFHKI
jgi:hypothetical protein